MKLHFTRYLLPFVFFALFRFGTCNSFAQQFGFKNYSVNEGIAQSQIYSLLCDSRGYLWMGSRGGGLIQYDGTAFKTFTVKDKLGSNYISDILEDKDHNLWIGTNNGLSRYDGRVFKNYLNKNQNEALLIYDVEIDVQGKIWVASNQGLFTFNGTKFETPISAFSNKPVTTICFDKNGSIWVGGSFGIRHFRKEGEKFIKTDLTEYSGYVQFPVNVIKLHKGILWIGSYGKGLYTCQNRTFAEFGAEAGLKDKTIYDIYFDNRHNLWLGTLYDGICQYNQVARSFNWITENEGLSNNHVRTITQDRCGNYWFGTSGGGVCNYFGKQFTHYTKQSGLAGNFIYSIHRDRSNRLWVGNSNKGVSVLDTGTFNNIGLLQGFADVKVKAFAEDSIGTLYLGTEGNGLYTYNDKEFNVVAGLENKFIKALTCDRQGNLWIATAGSGLYCMQIKTGKLSHFTTANGLLHDRLTTLHLDKSGRLWYGTENNGLGYLKAGKISTTTITIKSGLPANSIRCLTEDNQGYLWIGTAGYGVAWLPLYQGEFNAHTINHNHGLTSGNIYLIVADDHNRVFAGSESGLDVIKLTKAGNAEIKHFGKGDGFAGIETCQNSVFKDPDGTLWFGTINGLTQYNPANELHNKTAPLLSITDVKLYYESLYKTQFSHFVKGWNSIPELILPYTSNHLTFDFFASNFANPEAVRFAWMLEGFDERFSPPSTQRTVTYSNVNPGEYTFMVKSCNEDGVWNSTPQSIKISIYPPYWKRWWFLLSVGILVSGISFGAFKWRINLVKQKAREREEKIQLEKDLLELEQKALRLQMNPHFIFNALNSIQAQIGNNNDQEARYYLAKFSRLMRQILDNSRNTLISLEEEINTLENYLLIEKFCNDNKFDYKISVDNHLEKDFIQLPPMLLQPFVENSIKHGIKFNSTKRGQIEVSFKEVNGLLECTVTDNGIGRKKAAEMSKKSKEDFHQSTALKVTEERLKHFNPHSDKLSMEIIDLTNTDGEAAGTQVIIRIPIN